VLFLHNTSRVDGEPYPTLLQDKGFRGFPSLCFMDAAGNVLAQPERKVASFAAMQQQLQGLLELRAKGERRTPAEQKELFLLELQLDLIAADALAARAAEVELTDAEQKLVAQKGTDLEVKALLTKARDHGPEVTGEKIAALAKAGRQPSEAMQVPFWNATLQHASKQKDAVLAQQAFDALMQRLGKQAGPGVERQKQAWAKLLEDAKPPADAKAK
jgi:hypothetical protein